MEDSVLRPAYWQYDTYKILDQIVLPQQVEYISAINIDHVYISIKNMNLRGAPLIGASASAGMALGVKSWDTVSVENFMRDYNYLLSSRPTAVNLKNVLDEMKLWFKEVGYSLPQDEVYRYFRSFSEIVHKRDYDRNLKIGKHGADFLENLFKGQKISVITHCNAGGLATCGYGTAIGVIRSLHSRGLIEQVWVDETRPYLQGSRLTAFELERAQIPHTVITDSTAAWIMAQHKADVVIVGADRMARNGDFANKIGTYSLAVNARYHQKMMITALPVETFDLAIATGNEIEIEERSDIELLEFNNKRIAPAGTRGLHLGFDVVPASLLTAAVTEHGVISGEINEEAVIQHINSAATV